MLVEVCFNSSITKKTAFLEESYFNSINKHREIDLLSLYNNGEFKKRNDVKYLEMVDTSKVMTLKDISKLQKSKKKSWKNKMVDWEACHHCKKLFHMTSLYSCSKKIRSSGNTKKNLAKDKDGKN